MDRITYAPLEELLGCGISKAFFIKLVEMNAFSNQEICALYHRCYNNGFLGKVIALLDSSDDGFFEEVCGLVREYPTPENWRAVADNFPFDDFSSAMIECFERESRSTIFALRAHEVLVGRGVRSELQLVSSVEAA